MYKVEINDDAVAAALARLTTDLGDLSDPMNDIGGYLAKSSRDRIDEGVSPDGTPFAPRSQVTLDRYAKEKKSFKGPLHQSGDMRDSIFHQYDATSAEVGTNAIQSAVMHFGAPQGSLGGGSPWGDIPARPFLGISEADLQELPIIIDEWFTSLSDT